MTAGRATAGSWLVAALAAGLPAQRGVDPDEFLRLEPVLQAAIRSAAPFVVTVETFGGTRRVQGRDGDVDGDAPPVPRPVPAPPPEDGRGEPKKPLVAPGFEQTQGRTTGVVLTADGWIVVSRFALALDPTTVLVTVPDRGTFPAARAGEDTSRGIALVKIAATGLPVPEFVHPGAVQVGQWAAALGRTFATDAPTVHLGIVSAKDRIFGRALQVDAHTSPANYGGPVIDVRGRVLGIAVPLSPSGRNAGVEWYDSGIGFAVTIADVPHLLGRLQQGQVLQRAWLGVRLDPRHLGPGARLVTVAPGSAAEAAGLSEGDVIFAVDGVDVRNGPHLLMLVSSRLGGDVVRLRVQRAGEPAPVDLGPVTLLDAPWSEQRQSREGETAPSFPLPEKPEGR